jgi:hypothetical protein
MKDMALSFILILKDGCMGALLHGDTVEEKGLKGTNKNIMTNEQIQDRIDAIRSEMKLMPLKQTATRYAKALALEVRRLEKLINTPVHI